MTYTTTALTRALELLLDKHDIGCHGGPSAGYAAHLLVPVVEAAIEAVVREMAFDEETHNTFPDRARQAFMVSLLKAV